MPASRRVGRRVISGVAAVALAFGMTALGATAASAAPAPDIAIVPGSPVWPENKVEFAGLMYFAADNGTDIVLYSFDGTTFTEVTGSGGSAPIDVRVHVVYDGKLYFTAFNGSGYVLYSWDGTDFEELPGSPVGDIRFWHQEVIVFGDELLFRPGFGGAWTSWDGTGFTQLAGGDPTPTFPQDPAVYEGKLYFVGFTGSEQVLFSWDGVAFDEISGGGGPIPLNVENLYVFDGVLYLTSSDGNDSNLWAWDGTDFTDYTGLAPVDLDRFIEFNGDLYFRAGDGPGDLLYRFDGTSFTQVVGGAGSAPAPIDPEFLVIYNGVLYFNSNGIDILHSWDGTVFTEYPAPPWEMDDPIVYNGVLYFSAEDTNANDGSDVEVLYSLRTTTAAPELADTGADLALPLGIAGAALIGGVLALASTRHRSAPDA